MTPEELAKSLGGFYQPWATEPTNPHLRNLPGGQVVLPNGTTMDAEQLLGTMQVDPGLFSRQVQAAQTNDYITPFQAPAQAPAQASPPAAQAPPSPGNPFQGLSTPPPSPQVNIPAPGGRGDLSALLGLLSLLRFVGGR